MVLTRVQGEVGGDEQHLGPLQGHDAVELPEAQVIAHGQPPGAQLPRVHSDDGVPGADLTGLPHLAAPGDGHIKGVELAVFGRQGPVGPDHHGAVIGPAALGIFFVDAAPVEPHPGLPGQGGQTLEGGAAGHLLGVPLHLHPPVGDALGQGGRACPPPGRLPNEGGQGLKILLRVLSGGHLNDRDGKPSHRISSLSNEIGWFPSIIAQRRGMSRDANEREKTRRKM